MVLGFILLRLFDIIKPWPCRAVDRNWKTSLGVVMDDVLAGVYGVIALHAIFYLWPGGGAWRW